MDIRFEGLPGADLVARGLDDLREGSKTDCALLVLIASPRLRDLGVHVPPSPQSLGPVEHELYTLLERNHGIGAYSRYNSLIRRMVSFTHALEHLLSSHP